MKKSFHVICSVTLIWNLIGIFNYLGFVYMSDEAFTSLSEEMQLFLNTRPAWVTGSFALAVFSGTIGNIGLLLRKKWANFILIISLISVVAQTIYNFIIQQIVEIPSSEIVVMILVNFVAVFLVYYSHKHNKA